MNAKYSRGFGITSLCFPQGAEDELFLGLIERVVVSRSLEFCGLLFEYSAGEIFGKNLLGRAKHDGVLDSILQFANISGPAVVHQQGTRLLRDASERPLGFL